LFARLAGEWGQPAPNVLICFDFDFLFLVFLFLFFVKGNSSWQYRMACAACRRELEQRRERWPVLLQREQRVVEREHERRLPPIYLQDGFGIRTIVSLPLGKNILRSGAA